MMSFSVVSPSHADIRKAISDFKQRLNEPFDTTRDSTYWKRALKHAKLNINDTTVIYPKFLKFCVNVYRWGDHAFNCYDSTYVVSSGKKWKLMIKNNNFLDLYAGHLVDKQIPFQVHSDLTSSFGAQICYMAVSVGYMFNVGDLLHGKRIKNKKFDFSFTCSRIALDFYYHTDDNPMDLDRLGDFKTKTFYRYEFDGVFRKNYGLYLYYFFNNKRYAQAAAYCYSKIQKKSQGSFILGFNYSHHDITMDFSRLPDSISKKLTDESVAFKYRDYSLLFGYGYNWVLGKHWLFNVTLTPSIGYRRAFDYNDDGEGDFCSLNYRAKLALVNNRRRFFYGLHFTTDGSWYVSKRNSFYCANHDINVTAGFRF